MFRFVLEDHKYNHIHFIGIGGISMSGLAEILLTKGYKVTGTDTKYNPIVKRLEKLGAIIYINHNKDNISGADLIIYTDAISPDNEELKAAFESGVDTIDRATFLGALMKNYTYSIAVSGTHGKTSTTSMITTITNHGILDPTVLLGGELDDIGGNVKLGSDDYILTEACEYKANILKYYPTTAIILNIDEDHLDYFKSMDHIIETFVQYGKNLGKNSNLIINADDPNCRPVIEATKAKVITFGIDNECDFKAEDIVFSEEGYPSFTLNIRDEEYYPIKLQVMGKHNIYNSLAAIATAYIHGVGMDDIISYLALYTGVHRRLELKGYIKGAKIIDDYAHHPTEIQVTLKAINKSSTGKIYCIFQPHTFTRTKILLDSFSQSFKDADQVIITDIYAAREYDNGDIHSKDLANEINKKTGNAIYLSTFEEIEEYLLKNIQDGDIVVTMGAGNVYLIGESILSQKKQEMNEKAAV
ncbi:MAG: UDP-N-acetylmuramate--L-alanine ligase [Tissierellaceae bacterium]|jgi:UDP-N-acetylmuramate--alanine ligase|nr:UDP-N-acetylmuramate--L-alanine ligase [Tissierellia bacterium]